MLKDEIEARLNAALDESPAFHDALAGQLVDPVELSKAAIQVLIPLIEIVTELAEKIETLRAELQQHTDDHG